MTRRRVMVTVVASATVLGTVAGLTAIAAFSPATTSVQADTLTDPTPSPEAPTPQPTDTPPPAPAPAASRIENVVFILADDLDWELFRQVPRLAELQDQGMTFTNHTVVDSLCCPSRVTILRSQYIHNHKVISNLAETGGGWAKFKERNEQVSNLPVWVSNAGVRTGLFGKYLNGYPDRDALTYVPPGWDEWGVPTSRSDSYTGYNYTLNVNGKLVRYGKRPADFLNDVITRKATEFIRESPGPFFLMLSTYSPHKPSPVATRNKETHGATGVPRTPTYNAFGVNEPPWLQEFTLRSPSKVAGDDRIWRKRAQSAESVADSVGAVLYELRRSGKAENTLVVLSADNGYHLGHFRLPKGKRTPYAFDTVVPLVMIGPGIIPGTRIDAMTSAIDLAPTFTEIFGRSAPAWVDGRSLKGFIDTGQTPVPWRTGVLSESLGESGPGDPDYQRGNPPQFDALRTEKWLYVEYADGTRTLYDREADPYELVNLLPVADPALVAQLAAQTQALSVCAGATCRIADMMTVQGPTPVLPGPTPPPTAPPSETARPEATPEPTLTPSATG